MAIRKFKTPLVVYVAGPVGFTIIETMQQASDFLIDHRSGNDSRAWTAAIRICDELSSSDLASAAFLVALKGAGINYDPTIVLY